MRTIMTLAGALLALAIHAVAARGQCPTACAVHSYQIDCKLVEVGDNGLCCQASPSLIAQEGKQVQFMAGGQQAVTERESIEFIPYGYSVRIKVWQGRDGNVRADLACECTQVEEHRKDGMKIQGTTCRLIGNVKLGETTKLVETTDAGKPHTWMEVVIREAPHSQVAGVGVNSDAGLTGSIDSGECDLVAPPPAAEPLCLPPEAFLSGLQPAPPPAPPASMLEAAPLPALATACPPANPIVGVSAAFAGFVPPPAVGPVPPCPMPLGCRTDLNPFCQPACCGGSCPVPCCGTALPPAPEPVPPACCGNGPCVEEILEHIRQLRRDRFMLATQKQLLEQEEKAALALIQKRLDAQCRELKNLESDELPEKKSSKAMPAAARSMKLEQKLDGILDRLNQLEERFEDSGKGKADSQKSSRLPQRPVARLCTVLPFFGPLPIAFDFGFPSLPDARQRDQTYGFWTGFFR
jgi:hypothetical protein